MEFCLPLVLFLIYLPAFFAQVQDTAYTGIVVDGTRAAAQVDTNFICATIDWWPHDKCNYNQCPWGYTSVNNLNLSHPILAKAIEAFKPLRIRIGGSLQDRVLYDVESLKDPCHPFQKRKDGLFGFSRGCLHLSRWDELNLFFRKTGAIVTFGLNALHGRHPIYRSAWGGDWDSSNAYDFIKYTVSKGYQIDTWEFGNELSGSGVGARVGAEQYGKDLIHLRRIINELYEKSEIKPSLVAPGGFYDQKWFTKLLQVTGLGVVDIVTHHIYNLGAGDDPSLINRILSPHYLNKTAATFNDLEQTIKQHGPWASAWVGESGGAYNSGGHDVSDTYVDSFWYLDQLGMAAKYNSKVYCRQSLIGGNYGLLDRKTFVPNPDYYRLDRHGIIRYSTFYLLMLSDIQTLVLFVFGSESALLWSQLMGEGVLSVKSDTSPFLRIYAHCSKGRAGITILLINLSNQTEFILKAENNLSDLHITRTTNHRQSSFTRGIMRAVSWVGRKSSDDPLYREEYHLTPANGYLRSKTMILNGTPLGITNDGNIPKLEPALIDENSPISIVHRSIKFVVLPNFDAPACA
ncbi:Glycoside hydrolase [Parasponia andersonii]|uniref:Glycoside hydrolase n=1 Tax=Parasponia andersonii TaxID=3476 RepID=A0A2P5D6H9_PARAD|nr:Glycoside hydrolase [Parasponia andersonii]